MTTNSSFSVVDLSIFTHHLSIPSDTFHIKYNLLFVLLVSQAVSSLQELPIDLTVNVPSQTPNWDIVSDIVNLSSRTFRSARQVSKLVIFML